MADHDEVDADDRPLHQLDDRADREELRQRYYGLLQELRVVLPGVQLLGAFLLTVPFAQEFGRLDRPGRVAYGTALITALLSVVCLLTPTVYHRVASRAERTARLRWGIRMTLLGMVLLGVALVTGLWCVSRFVFGGLTAWLLSIALLISIVAMWIVLPRATGHDPDPRSA